MRPNLLLLLAIILLYLVTSLTMQAIYGPSYGFLSGDDSWVPDGAGGWKQHGKPTGPAPGEPSVEIPLYARYLPIFLPAAVLAAFLFSPLGRILEERKAPKEGDPKEPSAEPPEENAEDMTEDDSKS